MTKIKNCIVVNNADSGYKINEADVLFPKIATTASVVNALAKSGVIAAPAEGSLDIARLYAGGGITLDPRGGRQPHRIERQYRTPWFHWLATAMIAGSLITLAFNADNVRGWFQ